MKIHFIDEPVTKQQVQEMLEVHESFIKVAVDIYLGVLAGGGEFHADCEALLIEEGSHKQDIWGGDWLPEEKQVRFGALINIRPKINQMMEIQDASVRKKVEAVIRKFMEAS